MGGRVNSSMGNALVEQRLKEEREAEEKQQRAEDEFEQKRLEQYWREHDEHQRKLKEMMEVNARQLYHKAHAGDWEKDDDKKQVEMWRRDEEREGPARREKLLKSRRLREEMDEALMETIHKNAAVHRSEVGISQKQKQNEVSYNRPLLERIHSDKFA